MEMPRFLVALNRAENLWANEACEASSSQHIFTYKEAVKTLDAMNGLFLDALFVDLMPWCDKEEADG